LVEPVGYRRNYALRRQQPDKPSLEVTFPIEVVDRKARELGITVGNVLEQYVLQCEFSDQIDGVIYTFILKNKE